MEGGSMSRETNQVLAGFFRLSNAEQQEIFKQISEYMKQGQSLQKVLKEDFVRKSGISLGPLSTGGCPCCGR